MNVIKKSFVENLINVSLHQLGELSVKITQSSMGTCAGFGLYETPFPRELLELEED